MNAFEIDTLCRLLREASRYWVVARWLRDKTLPGQVVFFSYPRDFDWGEEPGGWLESMPMRGKRVRITLEIEDY